MEATTKILNCGHKPSDHGPHTTGTAHTANGREICCTCADDEHRASLRTDTKTSAYLSGDGKQITTWTGGNLMTVTSENTARVGFGISTVRTYLRAVDVHGQRWHGTSAGRGMYCRMVRSK